MPIELALANSSDAEREIALELALPPVVVEHGGDAREQVLPRASQQRVAPPQPLPLGDPRTLARLDVVRPVVGVGVGRMAEAAVVVAVEMLVRVDQAGAKLGGAEIELEIEAAVGGDDPPVLDADGLRQGDEEQPHHHAFRKPSASTIARPSSAWYCASRPASS